MPENEELQSLLSVILNSTRTPDPSLSHLHSFGSQISCRRSLSVPSERCPLSRFEFVMGTIRQTIRWSPVSWIEQPWSADFSSVACSALRVSLLPACQSQRTSGLHFRSVMEPDRQSSSACTLFLHPIESFIRGSSDALNAGGRGWEVSPVSCRPCSIRGGVKSRLLFWFKEQKPLLYGKKSYICFA